MGLRHSCPSNRQGTWREQIVSYFSCTPTHTLLRVLQIPKNVTSLHAVSNVDFAPTLLDLAGVTIPPQFDGSSLKGILLGSGPLPARDTVLVSYHGEHGSPGPADLCPVRDNALTCYAQGNVSVPPYW